MAFSEDQYLEPVTMAPINEIKKTLATIREYNYTTSTRLSYGADVCRAKGDYIPELSKRTGHWFADF